MSSEEKTLKPVRPKHDSIYHGIIIKVLLAIALFAGIYFSVQKKGYQEYQPEIRNSFTDVDEEKLCVIPPKIAIDDAITKKILFDPVFGNRSAIRLSKSVQVDTAIGDDEIDPAKFVRFHQYLESEFPLVYKHAQVTKINTFGLLFEFPGTNADLKPLLFMGHQDTVKLGDVNQWTHAPFGGEISDGHVWGRGASDCKNLLIALMEIADLLVQEDFKHERGFIFAFGFDEESEGLQGASKIAQHLVEKYGPDSIESIFDEGLNFYTNMFGSDALMIATAEKGHADLIVDAVGVGGHSSMPPSHTSIGLLSKFLSIYEEKSYPVDIGPEHPIYDLGECVGKYGQLSELEKEALIHARHNRAARELSIKVFGRNTFTKFAIMTSQAIDVILGGDKANSLPRSSSALINHRFAIGEDVNNLFDKATVVGEKAAKALDCGLIVNGTELIPATAVGFLNITVDMETYRAPAPVSPAHDHVWNQYIGLARTLYQDYVFPEKYADGQELYAVPIATTGSTDTYYYWALSKRIYRSQPGLFSPSFGLHDIDENIPMSVHLETVAFYYHYIKQFAA